MDSSRRFCIDPKNCISCKIICRYVYYLKEPLSIEKEFHEMEVLTFFNHFLQEANISIFFEHFICYALEDDLPSTGSVPIPNIGKTVFPPASTLLK